MGTYEMKLLIYFKFDKVTYTSIQESFATQMLQICNFQQNTYVKVVPASHLWFAIISSRLDDHIEAPSMAYMKFDR